MPPSPPTSPPPAAEGEDEEEAKVVHDRASIASIDVSPALWALELMMKH